MKQFYLSIWISFLDLQCGKCAHFYYLSDKYLWSKHCQSFLSLLKMQDFWQTPCRKHLLASNTFYLAEIQRAWFSLCNELADILILFWLCENWRFILHISSFPLDISFETEEGHLSLIPLLFLLHKGGPRHRKKLLFFLIIKRACGTIALCFCIVKIYKGFSKSNASYFIMLAHNVRGLASAYKTKGSNWIPSKMAMLTFIDVCWMFMETKQWVWTWWGDGWYISAVVTASHLHWCRFLWVWHAGSCSLLVKMHS